MPDKNKSDESKLQERFVEEIRELEESGAGMPFVFTPLEAFYLLSLLQLVLRHPEINRPGHQPGHFAEQLARNIESRLCKSPAMAEIARRGWDPNYDNSLQ